MDCIPLICIWGCPTKLTPEGDSQQRVCPRCHNAAVVSAKSRTWFEFCFVPLVPFHTEHVYHCNICNWETPQGQQYVPPLPQQGGPPGGQQYMQPGWQPPPNVSPGGWQKDQQGGGQGYGGQAAPYGTPPQQGYPPAQSQYGGSPHQNYVPPQTGPQQGYMPPPQSPYGGPQGAH